MPSAIAQFRKTYDRISLIVRTHTTREISEMIAKGRADVGAVYGAGSDETVTLETACEVPIGCLMHPDNSLRERGAIRLDMLDMLDMLDGQSIIALGTAQPVGAAMRQLINEEKRQLAVSIEVSQSVTACALVEQGLGVAILDALGLKDGRRRGLVSRPSCPGRRSVSP